MARLVREDFAPYVREIADSLELRDWRIVVCPDPPDDPDDMAWCLDTRGMKRISIRLADKFFELSEEEQRYYVVHEVVHIHDAAQCQFLNDVLTAEQYRTYELLHEYLIDGIAHAIAPLLPLPSEILDADEAAIPVD